MTPDGAVLFIGAESAVDGTENVGSVVVFHRDGLDYVAGQRIVPPADWAQERTRFGKGRLAVSRDGTILAVAASGTVVSSVDDAGVIHLYARKHGEPNYDHLQTIQSPNGPQTDEYFGGRIALDPDGSKLFVGGRYSTNAPYPDGYVHVFALNEATGTYALAETLLHPTAADDDDLAFGFGNELALAGSTGELFVTARGEEQGTLYRFVLDEEGAYVSKGDVLTKTREVTEDFGVNVGVSDDGSRLIVASDGNPSLSIDVLYTYGLHDGSLQELSVHAEPGTQKPNTYKQVFGTNTILVSSDGTRLLVDAADEGPKSFTRELLMYDASGEEGLTLLEILRSPLASGRSFGQNVAASADFSVIVVGDDGGSENGDDAGQAHVIVYPFW